MTMTNDDLHRRLPELSPFEPSEEDGRDYPLDGLGGRELLHELAVEVVRLRRAVSAINLSLFMAGGALGIDTGTPEDIDEADTGDGDLEDRIDGQGMALVVAGGLLRSASDASAEALRGAIGGDQ
jgi:hypothetical protein